MSECSSLSLLTHSSAAAPPLPVKAGCCFLCPFQFVIYCVNMMVSCIERLCHKLWLIEKTVRMQLGNTDIRFEANDHRKVKEKCKPTHKWHKAVPMKSCSNSSCCSVVLCRTLCLNAIKEAFVFVLTFQGFRGATSHYMSTLNFFPLDLFTF